MSDVNWARMRVREIAGSVVEESMTDAEAKEFAFQNRFYRGPNNERRDDPKVCKWDGK